ncbi:MAG: hypothetical protein JRI87_09375 [Deltaproteobacteria bacterium]|jgi:hypothetical protein|nr:hypothetical protein [Deltaproteobacteria bacterium]MBW1856623.1 hypothetical protein [Deltaproteobacteria bacterium]
MSEKCEAMNYCPVYRIYEHLSSSEAGEHLLNAKKEMLLAVKSLIEKEVKRTEKKGKSQKARKVKIK